MLRRLNTVAIAMLIGVIVFAGIASAAGETKHVDKAASASTGAKVTSQPDYLSQLEAAEKGPTPETKEPSVTVTALSFIFKLALVLALAYGTVLGLKKFTSMKSVAGPAGARIRVIENSSLGANRSLHIVAVGSKRLLVASTQNQINLVAELDSEDAQETTVQTSTQTDQPSGGSSGGFKDQLSMFLGNKPDSTQSAKTVAEMLRESNSFLQDKVREVGHFRRIFRDAGNG
ncbi:MAG: flagellar biosynthetic protein FliO [Armatimonadota bacterium]|nr:flagellar biosynthetic protein FliO [bacterium]